MAPLTAPYSHQRLQEEQHSSEQDNCSSQITAKEWDKTVALQEAGSRYEALMVVPAAGS